MSEANTKPATFTVNGTELEFPRVSASVGNDGVQIANLLKETGLVTLDPGFMNTANTESQVTYVDGEQGILRYRGYPIDQLAEQSTFLEVAYLLIYGELPSAGDLANFEERINTNALLHENFQKFFTAFPLAAHPMAVLQAGIAGLGTYHQDTLDPFDPKQLETAAVLLLAQVPTMIAAIAKRAAGQPQLYPDTSLGYVEDFLRMTFSLPYQDTGIDPVLVDALDMLLILHADHEQNCATSTVRIVGAADADLFAAVSAGVGALAGPAHGGANEAVLRMLNQIHESGDDAASFVNKVKNREDGVRLMGFGHRVYRNYDPRAAIVKTSADEVLTKLGVSDPLLNIARELEEIALSDDYFIERKLYPNVDFYTGLIYKAMGFTTDMFTPLFALGRLPGWIAQYREMINDPTTKIGRPRQVYTGAGERQYAGIEQR